MTACDRKVLGYLDQNGEFAIVSHADGDTVQADDELVLVGQSKSKFFALPDDQVTWTVIRDGSAVRSGFGHELTVPGELMEPGGYEVRFLGHAGTYFRWTASRAGDGGIDKQVLCEGTNAVGEAAPGGGGLAATKDCAGFTAELAGHHYAGHTNYTITLQVWDVDGNTDTATRSVKVYTPPVS